MLCGYWKFDLYDTSGGWATDGCELQGAESGRIICVCDHLTNFAVLVNIAGQDTLAVILVIKIISWIGVILSIGGLTLTILSFIIFKHMREGRTKNSQQTIFNIALSLLCFNIVFITGINQTQYFYGCIAVAALIHYFIIVAFMWMFVYGIVMYLNLVKVLGVHISKFMLKAAVPAWGIPLVLVGVTLAIDYELYKGGEKACWMSLTAFYYVFAIPVALVILANIIIFLMIAKTLFSPSKGLRTNQSKTKRTMNNLRAAASLLLMLGLTWIFGFFTIEEASVIFQYIFTVLNAFQGFLIFILFTARNKQVRKDLKNICCKPGSKDKYTKNTSKTRNIKDINGNSFSGSGYITKQTGIDISNT